MPDGSRVSNEDVRESVEAWTREIIAKCRNYRVAAGVFLVVTPLDDPRPQWAHNMTPAAAAQVLRRMADEVLAHAAGLVVAGPCDIPKV